MVPAALREEAEGEELMAETVYDGPPSPGDTERALIEVAAERDQLRQQVERLLKQTDDLRRAAPGARGFRSRLLYSAADQVRKELGDQRDVEPLFRAVREAITKLQGDPRNREPEAVARHLQLALKPFEAEEGSGGG